MNLAKALSTLRYGPLCMEPKYRAEVLGLLESHARLTKAEYDLTREGVGMSGEKVDLDQMTIENGLAHIPVKGPLGFGLSGWEKGMGCTDYQDIMDNIDEAEESPLVMKTLFHFDSPGGMYSGLPECAATIMRCQKDTWAVCCGGQMDSAAYWLASACDGISITDSSEVGSIGVRSVFMDSSKMLEGRGISLKVFSSGKYKSTGLPGTKLTKEQEEYLQGGVDAIAKKFYAHVLDRRDGVSQASMQGQVFMGDDAVEAGLADEKVFELQDVIDFLS